MKKFMSVLLALCLMFGVVPLAASAEANTKTIYVDAAAESNGNGTEESPYKTLTDALTAASNGDSIVLAAGEYTGPTNNFAGKIVNLQGAGDGTTTIKGGIWMGSSGGPGAPHVDDVSDLTITGVSFTQYGDEDTELEWSNVGLGFSQLEDIAISISNCAFDGFQYGAHMNQSLSSSISISNTTFTNCFGATSVQSSPRMGQITFGEGVVIGEGTTFAVQAFGTKDENNFDYNFTTPEDYETAAENKFSNIGEDDVVSSPIYVTNQQQLQDALNKGTATIYLGDNITLSSGLNVTSIQNITVDGRNYTISFERSGPFDGVFGNSTSPIEENRKLTVRNLVIENISDTNSGWASVVGTYETGANNAVVTYENCTFKNLGAAVYVNTAVSVSATQAKVVIKDCQYDGTPFSVGADSPNVTEDVDEVEPTNVVYLKNSEGEIYDGYTSIQAALNAATNKNNVVEICDGDYTGNITINNSVEGLQIQGSENTVIKNGTLSVASNDINLPGLTITGLTFENGNIVMSPNGASDLSNMTISGNTFRGQTPNTNSAIHFNFGSKAHDGTGAAFDGLTISNNTITNIENGSNSGILIIGDGAIESDVTISGNKVDGVGWNGIQVNNVKGGNISIIENELKNCDATGDDGVINLYNSTADTFTVTENFIIPNEEQKYLCYISDDIDASHNYWGTTEPDFESYIHYNSGPKRTVTTEPYYEAATMRNPQDLNTYNPSTPVGPSNPNDDDEEKPEEPVIPFTDVKDGAWYFDAVKYVYENSLMAGTGDTTFEPEVKLNRAMAAQILYNLEGQPTVTGEETFTDADDAGAWAVNAITWAEQNEVVAGIGGGLFDPTAPVTREAFAQMMYNYAKFKGYDLTKTGDLSKFPDADTISDWAETALSWANGNGLINGHEDSGKIDPAGTTTRAQAASIIRNFDLNVAK